MIIFKIPIGIRHMGMLHHKIYNKKYQSRLGNDKGSPAGRGSFFYPGGVPL
jgi:hypothetical protein